MLPAAKELAEAGYRAVLVDLRGHGRSTGKYTTFGVQAAKDLSQVIDALVLGNHGRLFLLAHDLQGLL
jgi:pimeloyl-ACP methyl ester carboxylesterase